MRLFVLCVIVFLFAARPALAAGSVWRVAERIDVEPVPSWFPVGFCLLTHGKSQYAAYYDANHRMTVGRRSLDERKWQLVKLDSKIGWDTHNYVTMAVDSAGCLHLSGNMHCVPLIYFRTEKPGDITTLRRHAMTGEKEDRCTYPKFLRDKAGRLIFNYRDGGSGDGSRYWNVYDPDTRTWRRLLDTPLLEGEGERNAYPSGPTLGPDGRYHLIWVWRDTPDCATNHNLSYVRSEDLERWETAGGKQVDLPMTLETDGLIIDPSPPRGGMINGGQRLVFDGEKRPMVVYHKADTAGNMQIFAARFERGKWKRRVITSWDRPVKFSGGGAMPFIGIRISTPQRVGDGVWQVGYRHRDYGTGKVAFREKDLVPVDVPPSLRSRPELPRELRAPEIDFKGIGVHLAEDIGDAGDADVRYLLKWETLGPNHDRKRTGELPPASMLRLYKLVRD